MPDLYLLHFDPPYKHAQHYIGYAVGTGRGYRYAKDQADGKAVGAHELVMAAQWNETEISVGGVWVGEGRALQRRLRRAACRGTARSAAATAPTTDERTTR